MELPIEMFRGFEQLEEVSFVLLLGDSGLGACPKEVAIAVPAERRTTVKSLRYIGHQQDL